jgi:putative peptidoglycan lipid II flippase
MIRLLASLVTIILSAKYFGASIERDLWILALTAVNFVHAALWGPINETFRAKFIFLREAEGEHAALKKARSLFVFTNLVTAIGFALFMLFHFQTASLIAPGNTGSELVELDFMLQILAPSLLLMQITFLLSSILNAYESFYIPEFTGLISSLCNIFFFLILVPHIGIYSLAIAHYIGLILLFAMLVFQIIKQRIPFFKKPFTLDIEDVKPYILFALPFFIPYFFSQINGISEKSISTLMGAGSISIIDYSRKFIDIPMSVLYSVLNTIMIPTLSQKFMKQDMTGFKKEFLSTFQLGLLFLGLFVSVMVIGSTDIIDFAYNLGTIDTLTLRTISELSIMYGFSAVMIFCFSILGFSLISLQMNKTYAGFATYSQIIIITLNILLYKRLNVYIFPVSLILAYAFSSIILGYKFQRIVGSISKPIIKYFSFIVLLSIIGYLSKNQFTYIPSDVPLLKLGLKSIFLGFMAFILIFLLRLEERAMIINVMKKTKSVLLKMIK